MKEPVPDGLPPNVETTPPTQPLTSLPPAEDTGPTEAAPPSSSSPAENIDPTAETIFPSAAPEEPIDPTAATVPPSADPERMTVTLPPWVSDVPGSPPGQLAALPGS